MLHEICEYSPPAWTLQRGFVQPPTRRVRLAQLPTPIHRWAPPSLDARPAPQKAAKVKGDDGWDGIELFIKRDDMTGSDASGNKVRKLEFLMADCLANGQRGADSERSESLPFDSVITIGGIQSNHARATAVVSRQLGLEPHLILRGGKDTEKDPCLNPSSPESLTGNLLYDRLVGAEVHPVTSAPGG